MVPARHLAFAGGQTAVDAHRTPSEGGRRCLPSLDDHRPRNICGVRPRLHGRRFERLGRDVEDAFAGRAGVVPGGPYHGVAGDSHQRERLQCRA